MKRYIHNLLAALLTFILGVFLATLSGRILPRLAHSDSPGDPRQSECDEWMKSRLVSQVFGWDLTYTSLLRDSGTCPGDFYCEIAATKPQPPVDKYFAEWKGEPVVSSVLIEVPDTDPASGALWLIRTKGQAYFFKLHPDNATGQMPISVPPQVYDRAFETMKCWQQIEPVNRKFYTGHSEDGYVGFLSLFQDGRSRQMLLTSTDLLLHHPKDGNYDDETNWGRFAKTLIPISNSIREQRKQAAHPPDVDRQ